MNTLRFQLGAPWATALLAGTLLSSCTLPHYVGDQEEDGPRMVFELDSDAPAPDGNAVAEVETVEAGFDHESAYEDAFGPEEYAIWRSEEFRRRFAWALASETDVEPTATPDEERVVEKAKALADAQRPDRAIELLERNIGPGTSALLDYMRAYYLFGRGELEEAERGLRAAVTKFPNFRRAWRQLGLATVRQGRTSDAIDAFTRVVELGGGDPIVYGFFGCAHLAEGNPLAAETAYRNAVLLDPGTLEFQMGLAKAFLGQARYAEAASLCDQLLERNPRDASVWMLQARAYVGMKEELKAAYDYEMVRQLGAADTACRVNLGDIYAFNGLYTEGVDAHLEALELDEEISPERAQKVVTLLIGQGVLGEAKRLLEGIEQHGGERLTNDVRKELLDARARVAVMEGATAEEVAILEEKVDLDPTDGQALVLLGQHAFRADRVLDAREYFERAELLEGSEAEAKVGLARILAKEENFAGAINLLRAAQAIRPREAVQRFIENLERHAQNAR